MITVKIDEDTALEMLCDRVDFWRDGEEADLFKKMYEHYVYNGLFDGAEFDVKSIVDNDVVNWCSIVDTSSKDFKKLLRLYKKGEYDVSCEKFKEGSYGYIEAVSDDETMILTRC
ncbi:MAG: hypothetical protein J6S85_01970 [Methanobrevibacter sp.]|nr:hypothetical protein [Methanobrevibacter sp.]